MITRRKFLAGAGTLAGSAALLTKLQATEKVETRGPDKPRESTATARKNLPLRERVDPKPTDPSGEAGRDYNPVITPNSFSLPWKIVDGVKVFHLIAEPVEHEFAPGSEGPLLGI